MFTNFKFTFLVIGPPTQNLGSGNSTTYPVRSEKKNLKSRPKFCSQALAGHVPETKIWNGYKLFLMMYVLEAKGAASLFINIIVIWHVL